MASTATTANAFDRYLYLMHPPPSARASEPSQTFFTD
jgi:hypothetical protein